MNCETAQTHVSLYLDSELSTEVAAGVARHLEGCPTCRVRFEAEQKIEGSIRAALARPEPGDADAWSRAVAALPRRRIWPWAAAAAVLLAALGAWALLRPRELDLAREMARHHEKVISGNAPLSVETSDPAEVNAYFRDKLACAAEIRRPLPPEATLAGGRSCYIQGVPSAFYVIRRGSVVLTVAISPLEVLARFPGAQERFREASSIHCRVGAMTFSAWRTDENIITAVGALPAEDLERVVDAFR